MVIDLLSKKNELDNLEQIVNLFDLQNVRNRQIEDLSGGELQRFACAMVCVQKGDIFMFDEPSSYLDVKQRLKAALAIRDIIQETRSVFIHLDGSEERSTIIFLCIDTSSSSNMICQCWIIYLISSVFCMDHLAIMVS